MVAVLRHEGTVFDVEVLHRPTLPEQYRALFTRDYQTC
jgi:hypothetical protein